MSDSSPRSAPPALAPQEGDSSRFRVYPPPRFSTSDGRLRPPAAAKKVLTMDELDRRLVCLRERGRCIVMTNGCFDLLHPGHIASLEAARRLGDCLIVGMNSDRSVRELKGPGRPLIDQQSRAEMLGALQCVDYVVIFNDIEVTRLVRRVLPDVLVKSAEYTLDQVVGREIVERHGGRVVLVPTKAGYSTTHLVQRIVTAATRDAEIGPA